MMWSRLEITAKLFRYAFLGLIFLVSAQYEWATTYIINRVVNGDYGIAIAYCSVMIVLMLVVKLDAFLALILTSLVVALLNGMHLLGALQSILKGIGNTMGGVNWPGSAADPKIYQGIGVVIATVPPAASTRSISDSRPG